MMQHKIPKPEKSTEFIKCNNKSYKVPELLNYPETISQNEPPKISIEQPRKTLRTQKRNFRNNQSNSSAMGVLGCDSDGKLNDAEFSKPMPLIGLYVAAASLICGAAMAADLISSFRTRVFWFPCRFFTLNATSLTIIAVAIKLSVDLNTPMPRSQDQLTKLSSTAFICTVIGNSMPTLGIMSNQDLIMNIMALGILVVTIIVNISMQLATGAIYVFWKEHAVIMFLMLLLLVITGVSALAIPTKKHFLELKYKKMFEIAVKECPNEKERSETKRLEYVLMKFWMMAHTSSPQFVTARCETCTASGFICIVSAITFGEAMFRSYLMHDSIGFCHGDSDYKWSATLALYSQTGAIVVGTIAPAVRWFVAVNYRCPKRGKRRSTSGFKVENFWTLSLMERKDFPLSMRIKSRRCRKLAHDARRMLLDLLIGIQCGMVLACKLISFISVCFVSKLLVCCDFCKRFGIGSRTRSNEPGSESNGGNKPEITRFVLHLEGEDGLVDAMMRRSCEATHHWIQKGKKEEPKHLIELLETTLPVSCDFRGINDFDSDLIPPLDCKKPPNCWTLPLATLAGIAVALPDVDPSLLKKLLNSVNEGFLYAKKVEDFLDSNGDLVQLRNAAAVVWLRVDLYSKWLDLDLRKFSVPGKPLKETLNDLAEAAKTTYFESKQMNLILCMKQSPSRWPVKVLAANSMYRICQTLLLNLKPGKTSQELFEEIQIMISDVIAGCLSNIPRVITRKCLVTAIEVRQEYVRGAAYHLGRAEKILEIIDKKVLPDFCPDKADRIDEWRLFYRMNGKTMQPDTKPSGAIDKSSAAGDELC